MESNEAFYDFVRKQKAFREQIEFFDPEPQIIEILKLFPEIKRSNLTRLLTHQTVTNEEKVNDLQKTLQTFPFHNSLLQVPHGPLFRIHQVTWFLELWEDKNRYAPDYAPKMLTNGLKFVYLGNKLIVCFQKVSADLWLTSDHNPTTVIPLTHKNFDRVTSQHVQLAQEYLQNKEK